MAPIRARPHNPQPVPRPKAVGPNRRRPSTVPPWLAVLAALLFLGPIQTSAAEPSTGPNDEASTFFGLDHLWTMHLTIPATNWEAMEPMEIPGGPGPRGPGRMGRDYPEVAADLEWEGRHWTNISVRYKGNSPFNLARDSLKRSLKLDFNDLVKGQRFLGLTKLNLNNNTMDASQMQEAMAYDFFRRAGVPSPRTAFVRVYLNVPGLYDRRYLGLYTAVEQVDERFLKWALGTDQGMLLKPETAPGVPYFGNGWKAYKAAYDPMRGAFFPPQVSPNPLIEKVLADPANAATYRRLVREIVEQDFKPARLLSQVEAIAALLREAVPGDLLYTPEEFEHSLVGGVPGPNLRPDQPGNPRRRRPGPPFGGGPQPGLKEWIPTRAAALQAQCDGQETGLPVTFRRGGPGDRGRPPRLRPPEAFP